MKTQSPGSRISQRVAWGVWLAILVTLAILPVLISVSARNVFRLPKTLFFDGMMLLVAGTAIAWHLLNEHAGAESLQRLARHRAGILLAALAVIWTTVVSLTAVQPEVARYAPLTAFTYAVLFVATILFARGGIFLPFAALFIPALINAVVTVPQALHVWSPIALERVPEGRHAAIGFLGNPDYVGTYLIVPCVAAVAATLAFRRYRLVFGVIALVLLGGIFFSQSVTAVGATGIALFSFVVVVRSKPLRLFVAGSVVAILIAVLSFGPTRERAFQLVDFLRSGRMLEFSSFRLPAFSVAWQMFLDHPVTGIGPGNYEAKYMSYKLAGDELHPQWMRFGNANFGETHNDHLQVLAEAGLPGYLLFLGALACVAWISFRPNRGTGEKAEFARLYAVPAAVGYAVVALGQFPLYLTFATAAAVFISAMAMVWSVDESA